MFSTLVGAFSIMWSELLMTSTISCPLWSSVYKCQRVDCVVISGEDVCCSVGFGTLVGVFVFTVTWSEFVMTFAISCPLWSSVYECQIVECAFTSSVRTECGMFVMYCMQCCMSVSAVL